MHNWAYEFKFCIVVLEKSTGLIKIIYYNNKYRDKIASNLRNMIEINDMHTCFSDLSLNHT